MGTPSFPQHGSSGTPRCRAELAGDTEQCLPRAIALHLDHDDFLATLAPKPVIILAKETDFTDVRGAKEAYRRLKRLYRLLGHEDNIKLSIGPTGHGYSQENREAMYQWFNRATHVSDAKAEPKLVLEKDAILQCTPTGQVADLKSRTVFSFTEQKAMALAQERPKLSEAELKQALATLLGLPARTGVADDRRSGGMASPPPAHRESAEEGGETTGAEG
jgi:hypothetical protein